ncbi:transporter [Thalassomonas sp. M1454]|uniref:transporter n=1 Tax=Thalassomonas sp. M1454 TaxID=2594477 RepID=UPI00117E4547|nr:transporter [Thalassomonas sp. M1454]TRX54544.1 transporter [Thalassomonas sp. M1454]
MAVQIKKYLASPFISLMILVALSSSSFAQESDADKAAKELANPNTALASLNFKFQYTTFEGDLPKADDQTRNMILFQPSMPFPREDGSKILFRPAVPMFIQQPIYQGGDSWSDESGLGDISFDLAYAPKSEAGNLTAYGFIMSLPTGADELNMGESTTFGPEMLLGKLSAESIFGVFPNHQWDIAGDNDISLTSSQFFAILLPGGGWSYGTSPIVSYNWNAEDGQEWTVPVNFTVSKTLILSGRPWKLGVELNYYVEKPDAFGPEYMISFNITPVVENSLVSWFK